MAGTLRSARSDTSIGSTRSTVDTRIGTAPGCESREVSAVRAYEQLAGKARAMCGGERPVCFTARDWDLPQIVGLDVTLGFVMHGRKRVQVRIDRAKAARFVEALQLTLAG